MAMIFTTGPVSTSVKPFTCRTDWKTRYASSTVILLGEITETLPLTLSSRRKFLPVISLMNLTRVAISMMSSDSGLRPVISRSIQMR